jgi:YD repeat-containing protein
MQRNEPLRQSGANACERRTTKLPNKAAISLLGSLVYSMLFLVTLFVIAQPAQVHAVKPSAAQLCSPSVCNPVSKHRLDFLSVDDGMGGTQSYSNLDEGAIADALRHACDLYAQAHSNGGNTATFTVCTPQVKVQLPSTVSRWPQFSIEGQIVIKRNSDGAIVQSVSGGWTLAGGECTDSRNSNLVGIGSDGQCYCLYGTNWSEEQHACIPVIDNYVGGGSPKECPVGRPIYPLMGSKVLSEALVPAANGGLGLTATYDTRTKVPKGGSTMPLGALPSAAFDELWFSSLHKVLVAQDSGKRGIQAARGNGNWISFLLNGAGAYVADPGTYDTLQIVQSGFRYTDHRARLLEDYDGQERLIRTSFASGGSLAYEYSDASTPTSVAPSPGLLIRVLDHFGRSIQFRYELPTVGNPRIIQVLDAAGATVALAYDAGGNLSGVTWPDGMSRLYLHERGDLDWAVTGITDESQHRLASYGYDSEGRAVDTQWAGGADHYSVTYGAPPRWNVVETFDSSTGIARRDHTWVAPQGTSILGPSGATSLIDAAVVDGQPRIATQSQPAGAGCAASTSAQTYDVNGNVASRNDFNGTRACYLNDLTRNLEAVRVEGAGANQDCAALTTSNVTLPTNARKTSTQWHPDWRIETKVASPGRITTSVYNGQPDPFNGNTIASCAPAGALLPDGKPLAVRCKQVEQATTDAYGHLGFSVGLQSGVPSRVRTWTYNENGQVLTAKGPRVDLNETTTYVYYTDTTVGHTVGDLKTTADALGRVTTFNTYNKYGQVLQSTDPNGNVTVNAYDARRHLLTSSVAGETTTYSYDAVGQLTQVTQADGSWVGYEYDDAHRQKAVKDNLGNRIEYELNAAGNKTGKSVKDPMGSLKRSLARVMDMLGRVERGTGRE